MTVAVTETAVMTSRSSVKTDCISSFLPMPMNRAQSTCEPPSMIVPIAVTSWLAGPKRPKALKATSPT